MRYGRKVSCANCERDSSDWSSWCVRRSAAVTSSEAFTRSSSCDTGPPRGFRCVLVGARGPSPSCCAPAPAKSSSRSFCRASSALRLACSCAFLKCVLALTEKNRPDSKYQRALFWIPINPHNLFFSRQQPMTRRGPSYSRKSSPNR